MIRSSRVSGWPFFHLLINLFFLYIYQCMTETLVATGRMGQPNFMLGWVLCLESKCIEGFTKIYLNKIPILFFYYLWSAWGLLSTSSSITYHLCAAGISQSSKHTDAFTSCGQEVGLKSCLSCVWHMINMTSPLCIVPSVRNSANSWRSLEATPHQGSFPTPHFPVEKSVKWP